MYFEKPGRGQSPQAALIPFASIPDSRFPIPEWKAFASWDINPVWAGVFAWNRSSARVLEKAGFAFEGRLRWSAVKDGQAVDELIYAVLKEEAPPAA
jgi:hypothetical protein